MMKKGNENGIVVPYHPLSTADLSLYEKFVYTMVGTVVLISAIINHVLLRTQEPTNFVSISGLIFMIIFDLIDFKQR
tara:strand:+ start:459 stop:689 length:231 start_codon:yes stop_codon:yes gene_type:complete